MLTRKRRIGEGRLTNLVVKCVEIIVSTHDTPRTTTSLGEHINGKIVNIATILIGTRGHGYASDGKHGLLDHYCRCIAFALSLPLAFALSLPSG